MMMRISVTGLLLRVIQCKLSVLTVVSGCESDVDSSVDVVISCSSWRPQLSHLGCLNVLKLQNKQFEGFFFFICCHKYYYGSLPPSANVCHNSESTDRWMWVNGVSDRVWGQETAAAAAWCGRRVQKRPNMSVWHPWKLVAWLMRSFVMCSLWSCFTPQI